MKNLIIAASLIAGGALALQSVSLGHGGTYRGPGDTVPAGGGGTTGGGPATPGTGGPSAPGPSGPTTPGPATPGAPGGAPGGPRGPATGGAGDSGPDLTVWQFWWGFNREPYLNLKSHIHSGSVVTGSDDFFLGQGTQGQSRDTLRPSEEVIRAKVVPALIEALKNERSNDIVTGCMVALAKIGDAKGETGESQTAKEIKTFLADANQEIAETAALCLGILGNDAAENIDILTALLNNQSDFLRSRGVQITGNIPDRTRAFAAYALGLVGHKASIETRKAVVNTLAKTADGPAKSMATRDLSVACLVAQGLVPMPIDEAAMSGAVDLKKGYQRPAEINNRIDQVMWLMAYYDDAQINYLVRAHVPHAVANLLADVPTSGQWLKSALAGRFLDDMTKLSKEKDEIKQSCIIALGQMGDCDADDADKAIRAGLMAVRDELANEMCKNFALIAIAQCAGRPGTGTDPIFGINEKKGVRTFLQEQLAKGKSNYKSWAAIAVGVLERSLADNKQPTNTDMRSTVRMALKDAKAPNEVAALAIAMGIMRDQEGKDALREKLDNVTDDDARGYTAIGIGLIDDRSAIAPIQEIIKKSKYKPDLLKSAAIGLGLLGDKTIVEELITMLNEATSLSSQAAISSGLGFIGDARSIEPLIKMLQDKQKTDRARGFAAVALGIVADKEDLPWNTKISVNINYRANTPTLTSPDLGTGILDIL